MLRYAGGYAVCFDFKAYYFQFPLDQNLWGYFAFRVRDKYYAYKRAAMGCKVCVFMAQSITEMLADVPGAENSQVIIDNVMFSGHDILALERTSAIFVELCRKANVTIGEQSPISKVALHRGIFLDFENEVVGLKPTWVNKFLERAFEAVKNGTSWERWRSLAGMLAWAISVLDLMPGTLYNFFRYIARQAAKTNHPKLNKLDNSTSEELCRALRYIASSPRIRPRQNGSLESPILATDASSSEEYCGWGAILYMPKSGKIFIKAGTFTLRNHINVLEVKAVGEAVHAFRSQLYAVGPLRTFVDNTTAFVTLGRQGSLSFEVNTAVLIVCRMTIELGIQLKMNWIPSDANPADGLSRGDGLQEEELYKLMRLHR